MRNRRVVSHAESEATALFDALERYEHEISSHKKGHSQDRLVIRLLQLTDLTLRLMATIRSSDIARLRDSWTAQLKPTSALRSADVAVARIHRCSRGMGHEKLANR